MTAHELKSKDAVFRYQLLSRLQQDCEYFLGWGHRNLKQLWSGNVKSQIEDMKTLFESFDKDKKPEWLSWEDILAFEKKLRKSLTVPSTCAILRV